MHLLLLLLIPMDILSKPKDFVYLNDIDPSIRQDIRYFTPNNFTGRPVPGYKKGVCLLTTAAANQLLLIQQQLKEKGLGLKLFDCYRPQMAVNSFIHWAKDLGDQLMKSQYYPTRHKANLFKEGYIAKRSAHSRGSTVDLTLIDLSQDQEMDMGTPFDFFDERSHAHYTGQGITPQQIKNRSLLREIMTSYGFRPIRTEWWHFELKKEPYPDQYFNFPVE